MISLIHQYADELSVLARFGIDIVAMLLLVFGMYYRRYHDKELVTTAALFNAFVFGTLAVLSSVEFSIAAGFGLFAILALFTLRSEQISKTEITYFFGSVALAVICSIKGTTFPFVITVAALILISAWALDHPRLLRSIDAVKVTLDKVDPTALSDPAAMRESLGKLLGVEVMFYTLISFDYVSDMARINVFYRRHSA